MHFCPRCTLGVFRHGPGGVHEQARHRRVDAVSYEPSHATGVIAFPDRIGRKNDIGRPPWNGAGRKKDGVADSLIPATSPIKHSRKHRHVEIGVVVDVPSRFPSYRRWSRPAYWATVPRHETGSVRNSVSKRASSNPSPMYLPVARMIRPSWPGMAARCSLTDCRCFLPMPARKTTR